MNMFMTDLKFNLKGKKMIYFVIIIFVSLVKSELPFVCSDNVYCHGKLIHTVQMAMIYHDSKTFVDMKMKFDRNKTLDEFDKLMISTGGDPDKNRIKEFVENFFDPPGSEFENWVPPDWKENPKILDKIDNNESKEWISHLNELWTFLCRKIKNDVKINGDQYSIIFVPNPFIIPGGRFREYYYWDSYWIIKGLLHSEMISTAKGMLSNYLSLVDRFGFIPNGGRVYYKMRSQPPLLMLMVKEYLEATNDDEFLKDNIDLLEKEFQFWFDNRTVSVEKNSKQYVLARYAENSIGPRPESYREDYKAAETFGTEEKKIDFYSEIKSGAESGWDFSSRWFHNDGVISNELKDIKTKNIVPVDLNAILCMNAKILSDFFVKLNNDKKAIVYARMSADWKTAINSVLWNDDVGIWLDYNLGTKDSTYYFFASNLFPLWTKSYDESRRDLIVKVLRYLKENKIHDYVGGVPSSLRNTGQQWDFPNTWPPSQYAIIRGLNSTGNPCAMKYAKNLAIKWVKSNYEAYKQTRSMYEKYDATVLGGGGGGGEYSVQLGFGWTNGIIMDLLDRYPDIMTLSEDSLDCLDSNTSTDSSSYMHQNREVTLVLLLLFFYTFYVNLVKSV